jgi:ATP-dependent Zn protease
MYFDEDKRDYSLYKPYSEKTAEKLDEKIKQYISDCYKEAKKIIEDNKDLIEKMSKILLEKEYLTKEEFNKLMNNEELRVNDTDKKETK